MADGDIAEQCREALDTERLVPHGAFERNALIDGSRIQVSNVGYTIYLDGQVDSWTAMDQAVDTAWSAPGVQQVVNRLQLDF